MIALPAAPAVAESTEVGMVEATDTCSAGFVGLIAAQAPGCLDPCKPAVCTAVGSAIGAYMRRHNVDDVTQAVCANPAPFRCLLQPENIGRCRAIFEKAKQFGLPIPESTAALNGQCSHHVAESAMSLAIESNSSITEAPQVFFP